MSAIPIWASLRGDHRGAMQSPASGARAGRVRFELRLQPFGVCAPPCVDADGRIWLVLRDQGKPPALVVLSPRGERLRELPLEGWDRQESDDSDDLVPRLLLVPGGVWIAGRSTLERRDTRGELLHRIAMDTCWVLDVAATPAADVLVWRQPDPFTSELVCYAADGAVRWSVETPQGGCLYRCKMACDDGGTTYISATGRLGDGVSGNDRPSGGLAIVSRDGTLVPAPALPGTPWDHGGFCAAREASAVVGTRTQVEVDGRGRILRQLEVSGDDPAAVPWDGYRMKLTARSQVLDPSLVLGFYEGTQQVWAVVDAEGVRYFEMERMLRYDDLPSDPPAIVAVNAEDRCLFRIPTASIGVHVWTALAIGPEGTLLVVHRDGLTAID